MAPYHTACPSLQKTLFTPFFLKLEIFIMGLCVNAFSLYASVKISDLKNGVITSSQINVGSSGDLDELYGAFFFFCWWLFFCFCFSFKTSPKLFQLFRKMQQHCFAVKLEEF